MATLATDSFTGSNGAAWAGQWATSAGNGGTATFTIQSNAGQWTVSSASTYPQAFLSGMSATTDCDFYCDFKVSTNSVQSYLFFGVSVPSAVYESADPFFPNQGYGVQLTVATSAASSVMQLYRCAGGGYSASGASATITVTAGSWYTMYVKRRGSTISAFFYAQGGSVPASPQCTWTDPSPLAGGKCLVTGAPESTSNAQAIDNVSVTDGTNSVPASVAGPVATVTASAAAGSVAASSPGGQLIAGPVATVSVSAAAGSVFAAHGVTVAGPVAKVTVRAMAGGVTARAVTKAQPVISSDKYRSGGYRLTYTVDAARGGSPVTGATGMQPVGGQIVDTMKPGPRRTLTLDLPQIPGLFDLLAPTGTTLTVTAHVTDVGRQTTDIAMGVFDIDSQSLAVRDGKISLTAPDLWQRLTRAKFIGPFQSSNGVQVSEQIALMIQDALGASTPVTVTASSTATVGVQTWEKDRDRAIIDLASSIGAWVYPDRSGNWTIADVPTIGPSARWLIDANPAGILTDLTRQRSRTSTYNVVCVEPQSASTPTFSTVWVWDTDPASPTYAGPSQPGKPDPAQAGPFGLSVYYTSTSLPLNTEQARAMGYTILSQTVGLAVQASVSTTLNPQIDAGDVYDVLPPRERYDLQRNTERHIAETVTHPLVLDQNSATRIDGRSTRTDPYT